MVNKALLNYVSQAAPDDDANKRGPYAGPIEVDSHNMDEWIKGKDERVQANRHMV